MDHIVRFKDDTVCYQHDVSDSFYIIVKGDCEVNVDVEERNGFDAILIAKCTTVTTTPWHRTQFRHFHFHRRLIICQWIWFPFSIL